MSLQPLSPAAFTFIAQVEKAYAALLLLGAPDEARVGGAGAGEPGPCETGLGGWFFYAGDLVPSGRAFTVAANIAGAATLAASADLPAARQAMREGVVDFLVNSLDEALRILKNQVRKREPVAVCVSLPAASIEAEMCARGVVPDISASPSFPGAHACWEELREARPDRQHRSRGGSAHSLPAPAGQSAIESSAVAGEESPAQEEETWLTWRVSDSPALWLPKLDALALATIPPQARRTRRWLEQAPRYLGRLAHNARALRLTEQLAGEILARFASAEIGASIEVTIGPWDDSPNP